MLLPALIPGEFVTAAAVLFLLFGVPAILFGLLMLYTGYVRYDAEQYIADLEAEAADGSGDDVESDRRTGTESGDDRRTGNEARDDRRTGTEVEDENRIGTGAENEPKSAEADR